jgi:hypothetical protein
VTSLSTEHGNPATIAAIANVRAAARRSAIRMTKYRALDYLQEPWQLDMLHRGFAASSFTADQLIRFGKELTSQETTVHRLEIMPVKKINARAATLCGRYLRRTGHGF